MFQKLPILYTLKECCSILKIGRNKMLELIWSGKVNAFKIGGHWRISEEAIKEYILHHVQTVAEDESK